MFRRHEETQKLLKASRESLRLAENKVEELTEKNYRLRKFVMDIATITHEKGQGTIVDRYDKIKMLVDEYQSNN